MSTTSKRERRGIIMSIKIKTSPTADTRTCDWSKVTEQELLESSIMHISDIVQAMDFFCDQIKFQARKNGKSCFLGAEMENWKHLQDERDRLRDAGEKLYPVPEDAYWRHCERVLEIIEDM